eukprot:787698-Ditylum_brightwellii.AAC.1
MAGATILMMLIIIVHQQVDVVAGEGTLIMKVVIHIVMKVVWNASSNSTAAFMATMQVVNHLISITERTLNTSGAYQSFGPG